MSKREVFDTIDELFEKAYISEIEGIKNKTL